MSSLVEMARAVRSSQRQFAACEASLRSASLLSLAEILSDRESEILAANDVDIARAESEGIAPSLRSRLRLTSKKMGTLKEGLQTLASSTDPVGEADTVTTLDDGLVLTRVMSPIGVLLIIFESRPDAVIQIGGLAMRSGNAVIMKGGREAETTNAILVDCIQEALRANGLSENLVVGVKDRASVTALLDLDAEIDLVIPRGSGALVKHIQSSTPIPVLGHAQGVCSLYIDAAADPQMAIHLADDGKCDYPSA